LETGVRHWLSLDDDLRGFLALAADDPALTDVLAVTHGLHQVRFTALAEGAAYFVLTQRTAQTLAGARTQRLADALGPHVTARGRTWAAFPRLELLAGLGPAGLAPFTGNASQTDYLVHMLRGLHDLGEEFLRTAPYAEASAALRQIRGVGEFTAGAILLRALGRSDSTAHFADLAGHFYGTDDPLAEVRRRYGTYSGWWGYLAKSGLSWLGAHPGQASSPAVRRIPAQPGGAAAPGGGVAPSRNGQGAPSPNGKGARSRNGKEARS
jgi:DNA-3-methyladenine glycosylase II